jgi:peptide/nickel transport system permease protein
VTTPIAVAPRVLHSGAAAPVRLRDTSRRWWARLLHRRLGALGVTLVALLAAVAVVGPWLVPFTPLTMDRSHVLEAPSLVHLLGTDEFGRDILSRIVAGARVAFSIGLVSVAIGSGIGAVSGMFAGYFGGWSDTVIMRLWDSLLAFPAVLLGVAIAAVLGPGVVNAGIAVGIVSVPQFARIARASVMVQRRRDYVLAARCIGGSAGSIIFRHILPNVVAPLFIQLALAMHAAVLLESSLSFLGLGTQPPEASWGSMLSLSRTYLRDAPWYGIFPGLAVGLLLLGLNSLADGLRDVLDPHSVDRDKVRSTAQGA